MKTKTVRGYDVSIKHKGQGNRVIFVDFDDDLLRVKLQKGDSLRTGVDKATRRYNNKRNLQDDLTGMKEISVGSGGNSEGLQRELDFTKPLTINYTTQTENNFTVSPRIEVLFQGVGFVDTSLPFSELQSLGLEQYATGLFPQLNYYGGVL